MKAAVLKQYRKIEWDTVPTPQISPEQVLIKIKYASICGSDQHIFNGDFHPRTKLPLIPGHEFYGEIVDAGWKIKKHKKGDLVAVDPIIWCGKCPACKIGHYPACTSLKLVGIDLDGGFAEYIAVEEHMLYKISENIQAAHAALIEILSIGFHACNRAGVTSRNTLAVWGAGKVGQSILQAARTKTAKTIFMVDPVAARLQIAQHNYSDVITINPCETDPIEVIKEYTNGKGVDIAFEAVGHPRSIKGRLNPVRLCINAIRGAGIVCVLGLCDEPSPLIMQELIWKEAKIIASRVSQGEFAETIRHLDAGKLKPDALISDIIPASEAQKGFELLENEPEKHLKILLEF
jgi:2-desacetyl-2-hydroxyethyl bacteriochlorophyllide A dehydrogenase